MTKPITTAAELVDYLFVDAKGRTATRLDMFRDYPGDLPMFLGTHNRSVVLAKVNELLSTAAHICPSCHGSGHITYKCGACGGSGRTILNNEPE